MKGKNRPRKCQIPTYFRHSTTRTKIKNDILKELPKPEQFIVTNQIVIVKQPNFSCKIVNLQRDDAIAKRASEEELAEQLESKVGKATELVQEELTEFAAHEN
uniref:Uncharacterized protein n=1 Tax=Wuchereria bancrofti TaxID=6293 RepID=A0A1I8EDA2_WUCBA